MSSKDKQKKKGVSFDKKTITTEKRSPRGTEDRQRANSIFSSLVRRSSEGNIAAPIRGDERVFRNPVYHYARPAREVRNPLKSNDTIPNNTPRLNYSPSLPDSLVTYGNGNDRGENIDGDEELDATMSESSAVASSSMGPSPRFHLMGTPRKIINSFASSLARTPSVDDMFPLRRRCASEQEFQGGDAYIYMRTIKAHKERKVDVAKYPHIMEPTACEQFAKGVSKYKVVGLSNVHDVACIVGPGGNESAICFGNSVCCQSISTYPFTEAEGKRAGDPICDYFCLNLLDKATVMAIADGCNWGVGPQEAARRAAHSFTAFLSSCLVEYKDTRQAARALLRAFSVAHYSIIDGKEDMWRCGTTTLLGGLVLPISSTEDLSPDNNTESEQSPSEGGTKEAKEPSTPQQRPRKQRGSRIGSLFKEETIGGWCFVFGSVGDCKAFLWSSRKKTVTDMTKSNRASVTDARDCGGRLGPYLEEGKPDLRNLEIYCHSCEDDDLIILVSDGVHDNLDPQHLGVMPRDLMLDGDEWNQVPSAAAQKAKTLYRENLLAELIMRSVEDDCKLSSTGTTRRPLPAPSPVLIVQTIMEHCFFTTRNSREFMETRPGDILPHDYTKYPGKMDHTTCVCVKVGAWTEAHK